MRDHGYPCCPNAHSASEFSNFLGSWAIKPGRQLQTHALYLDPEGRSQGDPATVKGAQVTPGLGHNACSGALAGKPLVWSQFQGARELSYFHLLTTVPINSTFLPLAKGVLDFWVYTACQNIIM